MDASHPIIINLLVSISRLSTAVEAMEYRLSDMERLYFSSAADWMKKERTCLRLLEKMTKRICSLKQNSSNVKKKNVQMQTDNVKKKEKTNQTDRMTTRTIGSLALVEEHIAEKSTPVNSSDKSSENEAKNPRFQRDTDEWKRCGTLPKTTQIPNPANHPQATDMFGEGMKRAPPELENVVSWMFTDVPVENLDRDITMYLNRISPRDPQIGDIVTLSSDSVYALSMEERDLFRRRLHMKLIERALTSNQDIALLIANVVNEMHHHETGLIMDPKIREEKRRSAVMWTNEPEKVKEWTTGLPETIFQRLSKFFHTISENLFTRIAWFICCLWNKGIVRPTELYTVLYQSPHYVSNSYSNHFLRKYLNTLTGLKY
uniref:NR LBD domain-containing protein n=1 Tax=Steinernema glaseri TaxID=37863 RepID=A0A1I7Y5R8_9BILA